MSYPEVWQRLQDQPTEAGKKDRLLNIKQVSGRLSCSKSHVYNLINSGHLQAVTVGAGQGGKRVYESEVERFLSQDSDASEGPFEQE